jgi:hypothetical protein
LPILPVFATALAVAVVKMKSRILKIAGMCLIIFSIVISYNNESNKTPPGWINGQMQGKMALQNIGQEKEKIGFIALGDDAGEVNLYLNFGAFLLLCTKNNCSLIDFYASTKLFIDELDDMNVLVVASRKSAWPDNQFVNTTLKSALEKRGAELILTEKKKSAMYIKNALFIQGKDLAKLIKLRSNFDLKHEFDFRDHPHKFPITFYFYKRKEES